MTVAGTEHGDVDHDELEPHGDGEFEPHRPPKYVEGVYKPHFSDPDADYVLMSASLLPNDFDGGLYWAQTDGDGDAAGVVRRLDGTPISTDMVVGFIYDGVIELLTDYNERIDIQDIPPKP